MTMPHRPSFPPYRRPLLARGVGCVPAFSHVWQQRLVTSRDPYPWLAWQFFCLYSHQCATMLFIDLLQYVTSYFASPPLLVKSELQDCLFANPEVCGDLRI
jgi:hypothetical protein